MSFGFEGMDTPAMENFQVFLGKGGGENEKLMFRVLKRGAEPEHLYRYITRPAIADERLKRNRAGQVVLQLKSAFRDGTTHIVMSPWNSCSAWPPWCPARAHI